MKKKLIPFVAVLIFISFNICNAQPSMNNTQPAWTQIERTTNYTIEYKDFPWYIRLGIWLKGLEFLHWKELAIQESILKNGETGEEKIISVRIAPKNYKDVLYLKSNGDDIEGFIALDSSTAFKKEEVVKLLIAWNYLHVPEEEKTDINIPDLFEDMEGNLYCKLQKIKIESNFNIDISILKKTSDKDGDTLEEQAQLKILLLTEDKNFSYIFAEHESGPKIFLNKIVMPKPQ